MIILVNGKLSVDTKLFFDPLAQIKMFTELPDQTIYESVHVVLYNTIINQ